MSRCRLSFLVVFSFATSDDTALFLLTAENALQSFRIKDDCSFKFKCFFLPQAYIFSDLRQMYILIESTQIVSHTDVGESTSLVLWFRGLKSWTFL